MGNGTKGWGHDRTQRTVDDDDDLHNLIRASQMSCYSSKNETHLPGRRRRRRATSKAVTSSPLAWVYEYNLKNANNFQRVGGKLSSNSANCV